MNNKITLEAIEANIKAENYFTALDGAMGHYLSHPMAVLDVVNPELKRMTFCVLTLQNGFMVFGESSCVSLDNYDEQLGRKYSREKAISKCWELMGYELKSKLAECDKVFNESPYTKPWLCNDPAAVEKQRETFPETEGTIKFRRYLPSAASSMTFGMAIEALKSGKKVSRAGWNGKGMWLSLSPGREIYPDEFWSDNARQYAHEKAAKTEAGGKVTTEVLPTILMKTINTHGREAILMGWLASQTDMLAEDWMIV